MAAKQGTITAPGGTDATIKALGDASPVRNTLAGVMRDAFASAVTLCAGLINLVTRKTKIYAYNQSLATYTGATGLELLGTFTKDDESKTSSPMTFEGEDNDADVEALLLDITTATKPSYSVESLCNAIETASQHADAIASDHPGLVVVVNQSDKTIKVYGGSEANVTTADGTSGLNEKATFAQVVDTGAAAQFGE